MQVEESYETTECEVLYFGKNYDLGATIIPATFRAANLISAMRRLFISRAVVLEVPEPLWVRFFPISAMLVLAWRCGGFLFRRKRMVVTYAIENNDFKNLICGRNSPSRLLIALARIVFGRFVSLFISRVAFGSPGAARLYQSLGLSSRVQTKLFIEIPGQVQRAGSEQSDADVFRQGVVFVGRIEERKGILALMRSWPEVERLYPQAVLTVVGSGPLDAELGEWCSFSPESRVSLGLLEHERVGAVIRANTVLVAPSIPWGRWREQIGLPIGEALREGLTVVTTSETGIAGWLSDNGHSVLPIANLDRGLGIGLINALTHPLDRNVVRDSLPQSTPRIDADRWMHAIGAFQQQSRIRFP